MPPAYDATTAYFAIADDRIVAYDVLPGTQKWIVSARPQMELVAGDSLVFVVEPGTLTALRASDGGVAWQLPFAETLAVHPVWDNGWLVAATNSGSILAFRATDGQLLWSREIGSRAHALPALAADRVYVSTADGRVVALRVDTGSVVWDRRLGGPPDQILALDDRLFVGSTDNFFYSLMTKDGRIAWRWRTGGDVIGLPVVDEHRVYFVALDNVLRALHRKSGVQQWMRPLPVRPTTGPAKVGDALVVTGLEPPLRCYALADGAPAGEVEAGADVAWAPRVFDDQATGMPLLLFLTRDLAKGASATLITRSFDPKVVPLEPLPNLITFEATQDLPRP